MAKSKFDLTGQRFGRLTVIERADVWSTKIYWRCVCDCGAEWIVLQTSLRGGRTRSCGCLQREVASRMMKERNSARTRPKD